MSIQWTSAAKAAAQDAQAYLNAKVIVAAMQRAKVLAAEAGSSVVDTDLRIQALVSAHLPGLDDEQDIRPQ
ncbi:MAG TPA: hypothetical protein VGP82_01710, partial [Ktedonobacterales bacterium]|nr:hypothetical protein [Ktedonobacterales bacterium]